MRAAGPCHHDDASLDELIALFAAFRPREEGGLVHMGRELNIHGSLIMLIVTTPPTKTKGAACAAPFAIQSCLRAIRSPCRRRPASGEPPTASSAPRRPSLRW